MARVRFEVEVEGKGSLRAWWARFHPEEVEVNAAGRAVVKATALPKWLERPELPRTLNWGKASAAAEAEIETGWFIRVGAEILGSANSHRAARIASPALIVEEGAYYEARAADGQRRVVVRVYGARPA